MQDITVRNKEIRFRSDRIVVEGENRAEKIRFTVTEASSIEGLSGMAFYMQYRNRLGEVGMDNLVKSTEGDNLYLDWLPSASFTKESGVVEVQIIGFTQSLVLTEDLTFQSGKLYFTSEGAYIPVYPATSSESPKVGQSISGSVYENEETLSDHRWSSQKAVLILPEDVFQGGTPVYTETQVKSLITEIATQLALAEDAADTASAAALAAQSYKTDAETARTQAQNRASAAEASKDKAEDWASKFNDANPSATQPVEDENYSAKKYAYDANVSEAEATEQRLIAEGYAVGEQRGTPVGPLSPYFQNNAKFFYQSVQDTNLTKADKVDQATAGDLAGLDAHGNLTDSGIAASNVIKKTDVVNSTSSDSETLPLSAKMGKQLQTQIDSLGGRGRFLSLWNSIYGLPMTEPESSPYTYRSGDYYIVSKTVETELALADDYSSSATYALGDLVKHNGTLYECTTAIPTAEEWTAVHWTAAADHKPTGASYTSGVRSTTPETEEVAPGDYYEFDGSVWTLFVNTVTYAQIKGDPHDSAALDAELDKKYEKPSGGIPSTDMSSEVQTSLGKADSALQQHQDISGKFDKSDIAQTIGNQIDKVPSNAAVNSAINAINTRVTNIEETLMGENEVTVQYPDDGNYSSLMPNKVPLRALKFAEVPRFRGKSRAWNQLAKAQTITDFCTKVSDTELAVNYSTSSTIYVQGTEHFSTISGHKYLVYITGSSGLNLRTSVEGIVPYLASVSDGYLGVVNGDGTNNSFLSLINTSSSGSGTVRMLVRDLTLILSDWSASDITTANIPLMVQQIPDLLKWDAYDAGSLVDETLSGAKSVGKNLAQINNFTQSVSYGTEVPLVLKGGLTYTASGTVGGGSTLRLLKSDGTYQYIGLNENFDETFIAEGNITEATFFGVVTVSNFQVELGSSKTSFAPWVNPDTLSLPETVTLRSAGSVADELDVESGVITRNVGKKKLNELTFPKDSSYVKVFWTRLTSELKSGSTNIILPRFKTVGNSIPAMVAYSVNTFNYLEEYEINIRVTDDYYDNHTSAQFLEDFGELELVYELATPTTESIDPVPDNTLYTEGGGTVDTIQTQTPVIDNSLDVTYDIIPQ